VESAVSLRESLGRSAGAGRRGSILPLSRRGRGFEPLRRDPALFRGVRVDEALGTVVWPNGADLDPDVLLLALEPGP
jgi:hypothetical protein